MSNKVLKRGRKSLEELMLKDGGLAATMERPEAPYDLDEDASTEWYRVVNSMPPDHFIPANYHMLALLCQHIVESRRLSRLIASYCKRKDRGDVRVYLELLKQREAENAMILKFSRSCRITHQSTFKSPAVKLSRAAAQQVDFNEKEEQW